MTGPRPRRHDPDRRDRIVEACLRVIGEAGVAGTSARRVAAAADVPLGSVSYHFSGVDELLREAFTRFSDRIADRFEEYMAAVPDAAGARRAVVDLILVDVLTDPHELVVTHELYTLAARDAGYRELTHRWMRRSRAALERHFDPLTARLLDALVEGLTIHRALDTAPGDPRDVEVAVDRILAAGGAPPPGSA